MARAPREQTIEVYPEADRLGEYPHPRFTEQLYGHASAETQLAKGLSDGQLHHAWLFAGPHGIGKATLAYRFAKAALAVPPDGGGLFGDAAPPERLDVDSNAPASHLVRALSHPDLLVIRRPYDIRGKRFKTAITVDEVRRLRDFLGHKQAGGGWKVVIVDPADDLNVNAANALLKSLEEPPARVVFILISAMPGRLLTTIRSRCRVLHLSALNDEDLRRASMEAFEGAELPPLDDAAWPALINSAQGSVARLLGLASDDGVALAGKVDRVFGNLARQDWVLMHQIADEFAAVAAAEKFETFVELFMAKMARLIRGAATGIGGEGDLKLAGQLGIDADLASWAELWETLIREKAMQGALNLDRKAFVLDMVMRLGKLVRR